MASLPFPLPTFDVERIIHAIDEKPFPFLDNPIFTKLAFQPRRWQLGTTDVEDVYDGHIIVNEEKALKLGYRLYKYSASTETSTNAISERVGTTTSTSTAKGVEEISTIPCFVYFGRNTDVAADCDDFIADFRKEVRAHFLAVDYRGYGWSTGNFIVSITL